MAEGPAPGEVVTTKTDLLHVAVPGYAGLRAKLRFEPKSTLPRPRALSQ